MSVQKLNRKLKQFIMLLSFAILFLTDINGFNSSYIDSNENHKPYSIESSLDPLKLTWSGYTWNIKSSNNDLWGPGPNYFNASEESVWVDGDGYLHLKIRQIDNKWYCAEIYSELSLGYGTYKFVLEPGFENLDINVVVGLFTYLNDTQEIDIEFARWGNSGSDAGQYVVQPYTSSNNIERFDMITSTIESTHSFTWCEEYIKFVSSWGSEISEDNDKLINKWFYIGNDNPKPATEHVHMNLWLMSGLAPENGLESEIIIKEFKFIPSECNDTVPNKLGIVEIIGISIGVTFIFVGVIVIYLKRK